MNARSIGVVLVRLFCIYLAITAVQSLSYVVPGLVQFGAMSSLPEILGSPSIWLSITTILLPAICALVLWRNAERVLPAVPVDEQARASGQEIMLIGVSLLGLYLLVWGTINIVRVETSMLGVTGIGVDTRMVQRIPYLAQILVAMALLLGRARVSALLLKAKFAGTETSRRSD